MLKILTPAPVPAASTPPPLHPAPVLGPEIKGPQLDGRIDTGDRCELGYRVFRMKTAIVGARAASPVYIRRAT
jgi:hypothetical protein